MKYEETQVHQREPSFGFDGHFNGLLNGHQITGHLITINCNWMPLMLFVAFGGVSLVSLVPMVPQLSWPVSFSLCVCMFWNETNNRDWREIEVRPKWDRSKFEVRPNVKSMFNWSEIDEGSKWDRCEIEWKSLRDRSGSEATSKWDRSEIDVQSTRCWI